MRKRPERVWAIVLVGVGLLTLVIVARLKSGRDRVPWRLDLVAAQKESAVTHKPVILDFTAPWCGPCQSMKSSTWADAEVAEALAGYVPVSVDLDANPQLAQKYHVEAIPLVVMLDGEGNEVKRSEGYLDAEEFLQWLKN